MKKYLILLVVLLLVFLQGCSSQTSGTTQSNINKTLVIGIESEADVLDPDRAGGWVTYRINRQIHEGLLTEDLSAASKSQSVPPLKPSLATSWDVSKDGLHYTFHLRKNVKFQDGTPFNAQAVEFNFRRLIDKNFKYYDQRSASNLTNTVSDIKSMKLIDDNTIEFTMKKPFSAFLRMLAGSSQVAMISPTALKKYGNNGYSEHPVGTGPFEFQERVKGEKIVLVRNPNYWGKEPKLQRVIFVPLSDDSARVAALESGQVDMIAVPPPDAIKSLKEKGFNIEYGAPPHVWFLSPNFNNPYMKNLKVRQAIAMAIDRKGMAKELLKNTVTPAYSAQSPANDAYDPSFVDYPYDPKKAKQLLAEAGYPNGFTTTFETSVDGSGQLIPVPMAEWIQQDLAKIGIKVKLQTYEWISYLGKWSDMSSSVGFNQMSWGMSTPYYLYNIAYSTSGANAGKYSNPAFDKVVNEAMTATNTETATEDWKKANELIAKDAAIIPIVSDKAPYAMANYVKGFVVPNEEWYDLTNVYIKKSN
ncbi:ABC transporter substrate-binding protein [Pullulanibacillus sp. KACC 23026]|uniref:ABC transporter substrate-binding protein n=1 Tax=Pullulanibacillus sp. KACC 23026 TaxID=3028315 RepID=UPI0023B17A1C|nr:ABC transporter substrate-binding protein [Pullulanibacillus sp. KACC 23026]WEG11029.1 ABC transporter substrate-binding protein [Pullulanibacillus sp. KACC 23026]